MTNRLSLLLVAFLSGAIGAGGCSNGNDDVAVMPENDENMVPESVPETETNETSGTELSQVATFPTSGGIGLAFDRATNTLWTYGSRTFRQYDRDGNLLLTLQPESGESADDADLDFADADLSLGGTDIQAGTLLFTNGETDTAEVYAIGVDGTILATLNTRFGNSHVVGSAYSVPRGTFFLLEDRVPTAEFNNRVAEIDPVTGEVLNEFDLDDLENSFSVNFGDLEVDNETGNLLIVSNSQSQILVLSPEMIELSRWSIAEGSEGSLAASGIALDEGRGELYVQNTGGVVYRFTYPGQAETESASDTTASRF